MAVAANIPKAFGSQMPLGYCRIKGVKSDYDGIKALAFVWEHEAGHVVHTRRMLAWAAANGCAGATCGDLQLTISGKNYTVPAPVLYWARSALGRRLGCARMVDSTGTVQPKKVSLTCVSNVGRWLEFVADTKAFGLSPQTLQDLVPRDWAYPGAQYNH